MSIVLERLVKRYDRHPVVNTVSLEIGDGELFVLLGPSGSGKSTVLRLIAGLTPCDEGRIRLHGRDVTDIAPQARGTGFVFQNYALFKHMTVSENIEFPLKIRKVPAEDRRRRRDELLELVGLAGLGGRTPRQLSGGQQQRVALARALAHKPEVLLLDEPFGALDARIRIDLRRAVRAIQRELGIATIFVTHDQEEAFELADRMGVMNSGRLLEVGTPHELYLRPQTEFVAAFLGTANLLVGTATPTGVRVGPVDLPIGGAAPQGPGGARVQVLFRPEDVAVKTTEDALSWPSLGEGTVEEVQFTGSFERLRLRVPGFHGVRSIAPPVPFGADWLLLEATRSQHQARRFPLQTGDRATVGIRRLHALTHPGLSLLVAADSAPRSGGAFSLGVEIGRLSHARLGLLLAGAHGAEATARLQSLREKAGSGLASIETSASPDDLLESVGREAARRPVDLLILDRVPGDGLASANAALSTGPHHLLLVPPGARTPRRILICVAVGEPGKEDIQFAGRLGRHLEASATVLTVIDAHAAPVQRQQAERFLEAGVRTLEHLGSPPGSGS